MRRQQRRRISGVGLAEAHDIVEAAAAHERRLDALGPVRRAEQNHALRVPQVVDLAQQLAENPLVCFRAGRLGAAARRDGIDRVEQQQARRRAPRLLEHLAQRLLRFAEPLRVELRAVDRDERQLLLARQRARHRRLAGARRADEQQTARRREADLVVDAVVHVRVLDDCVEQALDVGEPADGRERLGALLDEELARRARLHLVEPREKVLVRHLQRVGIGEVGREKPPQRDHADFLAERLEIGADEALRAPGDLAQIDVLGERHRARVNLQDLQPRLRVRHADLDLAIEAARPPQRRIEDLGDVGRADDDHLPARDEAVHQAEQLRDDALLDFADHLRALRRDGVDLVDEEDRGRAPRRFLEHFAQPRFALAVELPHDLGAVQVDEMDAALGGDGAREQRLPGPRRPVQQHALRREDAEPLEERPMLQRQLHHLAHARHLAFEPADVLVRHGRRARVRRLAFDDAQIGARADDDDARRDRPHDLEVHRLGERRHADRGAVDDRHALEIVEHALDGDAGRRGAGRKRRQPDGDGVPRFDARRRHLFLEPRAAIAAERAVDLHEPFVRGAAALGARDGDRAPSDLERVAGPGADPLEIARRQPGDGPRDVLDARLGDAQRDRGGGGGRFGHDAPPNWRRTCCAKRSNSAPSCGTAVRRSSGAIATRVASLPRSVRRIVPRFVCSIAQPSAFTEVTAMLRAAASLSQGTTSALMPCARASSSMARETRDGDPAAVNSASMARCGTLAPWSNQLERAV